MRPSKKLLLPLALLACRMTAAAAVPHADSSVLASGSWYKLGVVNQGIHAITWADLRSVGIDPATLEIGKIRLFGNGGGMLPETNSSPRIDDLRELSIVVADGGDGRFDSTDRILFYGEAADKWKFDNLSRFFSHQRNLYSDTSYYYLNINSVTGKRVVQQAGEPGPVTRESSSFDDFIQHELDLTNLIRSGKDWYGEIFNDITQERTFPFSFPDIDPASSFRIKWSVAAYAPVGSYFYLSINGATVDSLRIDSTNPKDYNQAGNTKLKSIVLPSPGADVAIGLRYGLPTSNSRGWLNYLELMCRRKLRWTGPQMTFRDVTTLGADNITRFIMTQADPAIQVWDVTNPAAIVRMAGTLSGDTLRLTRKTDSIREFIAFNGTFYHPVHMIGQVANQNLHASYPTRLVIVTNPLFLEQAERLGAYHRDHNGLSTQVVTTDQVYNEFSSGRREPTAIRDFIKMLYDRGTDANRPAYLLLMGDGSYDPKDRIPGNNNLIPTYQSTESLNSTKSYVTDDYFGIMADNSGQDANGVIDIGIGRFPVSTPDEARNMVDKILHYASLEYPVASDWRNVLTFVADDENQNLHFQQAEELCAIVADKYPQFNVNKIYFDAYQMIRVPGGERFPDASKAINNTVNRGSLVVNYTGHGGETGWSYEQVLTVADILSWTNKDKLPVFVTATCEFSRFDNPERFTAGEMLILRPEGGAIALYSTTRLAYAGTNIQLNTSFFEHFMDKGPDGRYIRMGDLIRLSKNDINNNSQLRNFVLLGDPAQHIAFSDLNVKTTSIDGKPLSSADTLTGLSTVTVKGRIEDAGGNKVTSFNGTVSCRVYDKPVTNTTLGNRGGSDNWPAEFTLQNSLLFRGDVAVNAGDFTYTFVVPRTIALPYGMGKFSYFAWNETTDATGYSECMIGGRNASIDPLNDGPDIALYLDDRSFISGGTIGEAAILLADLADTNGVNSVGLGLGHEIEAVLDNDRAHAMILNDYYEPLLNSYTRGTIAYPLDGLLPGTHTLSLKAWDMYDNSSVRTISFTVPERAGMKVRNVLNAPNPLVDHTDFCFQPEGSDYGALSVSITVYNLKGKAVRRFEQVFDEPGTGGMKISWDGTDERGKRLAAGLYPYKAVFRTGSGTVRETSQKLVIAR